MKNRKLSWFALIVLVTFSLSAGAGADDDNRNAHASVVHSEESSQPNELWLEPVAVSSSAETDEGEDWGSGGGCYTGCLDSTLSSQICGPGMVANALVSGPWNNCGLGDIQCKSSCDGPVVRCRYFAQCF